MTCVVFLLVFILDRSVASSSVHFSYKNHPLLLSFLYFSQKHIVRARPSYLSEILSVQFLHPSFSSVHSLARKVISSFFLVSFLFFILFENPLFGFCAPSPFPNPSVLDSVTTCRQCLVCQVTSRVMTGQVMKKCTRRVIEIQTT